MCESPPSLDSVKLNYSSDAQHTVRKVSLQVSFLQAFGLAIGEDLNTYNTEFYEAELKAMTHLVCSQKGQRKFQQNLCISYPATSIISSWTKREINDPYNSPKQNAWTIEILQAYIFMKYFK
jgi:hypothetical protein